MRFAWLLFLLAIPALASDPLPALRKPAGTGWTNLVGVPGGIPHRTTIFQTISAGAAFSTIQTAVNSCPSNQVVKLGAGAFSFGGNRLSITTPGVTLRGTTDGNGKPTTIISSTDHPSIQVGDWHWWGNNETVTPSTGNHVNWTSGYAQGGTTITIADATGYSAGQIILLDQLNDSDTSAKGNSLNGYTAGDEYVSIANQGDGRDRIQFQPNRILSISGTTITLYEPIYMPNWNSGQTPQTWRFASGGPVVMSGVEDLEVADTIQIHNGYGCWVSNTVTHIGSTTHDGALRTFWSVRCTIEHNWYDAATAVDTYGIQSRASAGLLVQNNISHGGGTGLMPNGSVGSVWAYNVMTNIHPFFSVILQGLLQHGGFPNMNLYEGNYCPAIGLDNTWGGSAYNSAVRNRAIGYNPGFSSGNQAAFAANTTNRHSASIGNVLGTAGINTFYENYVGDGQSCNNNGEIYYFGYFDVGCNTGGGGGSWDTQARSTCIRAYNWTSATGTNSGIVLDGFASGDIPPSYYLASKPAFFGFLAYPAVDPANPTYSNSYTNIPAGFRDVFGFDPPAGGGDTTPPTIAITSPTSSPTYSTSSSSIDISGTASDDVALSNVTWSNDRGGSGTCTGTTSWSQNGITLQSGANVLTLTATDSSSNTATATLTVTYTPAGGGGNNGVASKRAGRTVGGRKR